jgi:hypothetical protein
MRPLSAILAFPLVVSACLAQQASESPAAAAARARQRAIKSIEFVFTRSETIEPGGLNSVGAGGPGMGPVPAQQLLCESNNRLVISGEQIRFEDNHPLYSTITNGLSRNIRLSVSDGIRQKVYYGPRTDADKKNSYGILASPSRGLIVQQTIHFPMMLACRGYEGSLSINTFPKDFAPSGERQTVRGRQCAGYKHRTQEITLWVDEAADHSVRRIRLEQKRKLLIQVDVDSEIDPGSGLMLPKSWKQSDYSPTGKLERSTTVTVTELHVNRDYDKSTFDLEFPPGIDVEDQRGQNNFRVRADRSLEEVDLEGRPTSWLSRNMVWLSIVSASCVMALAAVFGWRPIARRLRRTSGTSHPPVP